MRTRVVAAFVLSCCLALPPLPVHARQSSSTEVALSYGPGSAFRDAAVGLARTPAATGSAFSLGVGPGAGAALYDDGYWDSRYFGGLSHRWGGYRCADVWSVFDGPHHAAIAAGFYDDWFYFSDLYYDCVVRGPSWVYDRYHAYRPFYHGYKRFRHFRPRSIHISIAIFDPFWPLWGPFYPYHPFYAYDPWGHYWSNWVVYGGPRVRTVFVRPAPVYRRPSPIYVAGTTFKEDPRDGSTDGPVRRTAQPRPSSAPAATAPATGLAGVGIQAPPRRTAGGSGGRAADGSPLSAPQGGRMATPRRGDAGDRAVAPGPVGNSPRAAEGEGGRPVLSPGPARRETNGRAESGTQGGPETPSAVNRPSARAGDARARSALPRVITPQDRRDTSAGVADGRMEPTQPQVITPRGAQPRRSEGTAETPPPDVEHLTGPRPTQPAQPPSGRTAEPGGSGTRGETARPSDPVRGQPAAGRRAQPESREARPENRQGQPERTQRQPETRESASPETRQAPAQTPQSPPQTRQASPQTRQATPQTRQSPPQTRQAPPQTRQAPSRPSGGEAQPAPSSGGARPLAVPRRPSGGS